MGKKLDLSGKTFGRLVALSSARTSGGRTAWLCTCLCGAEHTVATDKLLSGLTTSCGCYHKELVRAALSHGHTAGKVSPTYTSWAGMLARCADSTNEAYGGRGISVCRRWHKFENFISDMGERPEGMSIDRIDNDKGYNPSNCRWADRVTQATNRSITVWYTLGSKTQSLAKWCADQGLNYGTVYSRIRRGWGFEAAMTTPGVGTV